MGATVPPIQRVGESDEEYVFRLAASSRRYAIMIGLLHGAALAFVAFMASVLSGQMP